MVSGCMPPVDTSVRQGFDALDSRQTERALQLADEQLRQTPIGEPAAQALYLRGRALEQRMARTPVEAAANLAAARAAYSQCLAMNPPARLKAYARASLGNVAFFQDDYAVAAENFQLAGPDLDVPDARAWSLYRTGLCLQRLGRFSEADATFAEVQRRFPGTQQAQRASEVQGARAFYLRIGTYSTAAGAETASESLRKGGVRGLSVVRDARGLYLLRVGPYPSYVAARDARLQAAARFPDALIVP